MRKQPRRRQRTLLQQCATRLRTTGDEPEPWDDNMVRATHKADDLLAARGRAHAIDPQTQQNVLEASQNVCQTPAISIKQKGYCAVHTFPGSYNHLRLHPRDVSKVHETVFTWKTFTHDCKVCYESLRATERSEETGPTSQKMGRPHQLVSTKLSARRRQRSHKRHGRSHNSTRRLEMDSMESDFCA